MIVFPSGEGLGLKNWKEEIAKIIRNPKKKRVAAAALCAIAALLTALCITIIMQSNIQKKYTETADRMEEQIYQNLINMTKLFAHIEDEKVDVQNKLIPALKEEYASAESLNEALTAGYGAERAVLDEEQLQAFETAFGEYTAAYKEGAATGLAQADMAACIADAQRMIDARYNPNPNPEDEVIVIDADEMKES